MEVSAASQPHGEGKDQPSKLKRKMSSPPSPGKVKCDRLNLQTTEVIEEETSVAAIQSLSRV